MEILPTIYFYVSFFIALIITYVVQLIFEFINIIPTLLGGETLVSPHTRLEIMTDIFLSNYYYKVKFNPFWDLKIQGGENLIKHKKVIFMANHLAGIDPILISKVLLDFGIIYKSVGDKSLWDIPIVSSILSKTNDIGIKFEKINDKWKATNNNELNELSKYYLNNNTPIVVFPEGGISKEGNLKELKYGFFKLAIETGTPIIPIKLENTQNLLNKEYNNLAAISGTASITIKKPISSKNISIEDLVTKVTKDLS